MQLKPGFILCLLFFSIEAFSYTCESTDFKKPIPKTKKAAFALLKEIKRQTLVSGLIYEITVPEFKKANVEKTKILLNYLESTESNSDQRSFFKLLATASDLDSAQPKSLKQNEVCEIMEKVNQLK